MNCCVARMRNYLVVWASLMAVHTLSYSGESLVCLMLPSKTVEIGTSVYGLIESLPIERGSLVKKGQVIAVLHNDVERATLDLAKTKAQAQAQVQEALSNLEFARQQLKRSVDLVKQEFISPQALEKSRVEFQVAEQRLALAREQRGIWAGEKGVAQSQFAQRTLTSPITGIVAERYVNEGERVENRAVARIVSISPLFVDVMVPVANFGKITKGMTASVTPELPNAPAVQATVSLVDAIIDGGSNTFRVRLEVPNLNRAIPAGPRCRVDFGDVLAAGAKGSNLPIATVAPAPVVPVNTAAATLSAASAMVGAAPAPADLPQAAPSGMERAVLLALENWRKAWARQDLAGYLATYVSDFQGDSPNRDAWRKLRESRMGQSAGLDIRLSDIKVLPLTDQRVRVQFRQEYQSQTYRDVTLKSLLLVIENGRWLIQQERTQP